VTHGVRFGTVARVFIPTVAVRLYRPIALALGDLGISAADVFAEFDMPDPAITGWEVRLPLPQIAGVWGRLLEVTGDPSFALRAAEHVDLTTCDVITYLEGNASTVHGALKAKFEFLPLITDAIEWTLDVDGDEARLTLHERPPRPPLAPVAEYLLGARHVFFRRFAAASWSLRRVTFRHASPADIERHRALFGIAPEFDAEHDQLVFERTLLELPMRNRDEALSQLLRRYATPALQTVARPLTWSERVEACLESGVDPGVAAIARDLASSPRTLQRSLSSEGTSYAEIAARTRRRAAERLLQRRELAIAEVAYALGFNDSSAFHHAFVRWTGTTPGDYRSRHLGSAFAEPSHGRLGARGAAR
jgi:AraC-like DNA-binding protein